MAEGWREDSDGISSRGDGLGNKAKRWDRLGEAALEDPS